MRNSLGLTFGYVTLFFSVNFMSWYF